MPNALAPTNNALNEPSAAFGFFPQLRRNRTVQDPEAAKDMPVQFGMGRGAATLGLPADIANIFRSPGQTEMFGETNYDAPAQFNWTTQHFQKVRPLQPTSPAGAAASNAGALLPLSPAEALQAARLARIAAVEAGRGGKAVLNMAGEEMANRMLSGRSTIPGVPSAFAPSPLKFASEPGVKASDGNFKKFSDIQNVPDKNKEYIQSSAESLAGQLRELGFKVDLQHSGSVMGPSSYLNVSDPTTGYFLKYPFRLSNHSKGVYNSQSVMDLNSPDQFQEAVDAALKLRNLPVSASNKLIQERKLNADEETLNYMTKVYERAMSKEGPLSNSERKAVQFMQENKLTDIFQEASLPPVQPK